MSDQNLPSAFVEQMKVLLPIDFEEFQAALNTTPPVSIRINKSKINLSQLDHLPLENKVDWHPDAYYLSHRPSFTLDPLFHAGAYYVQEASSMFLYEVLQQSKDSERPLRILDLCAAPGGKTTLIASWMPEGSILVANEVIKSRVSILKQNVTRWGNPSVFTCNYDPEAFLPLAGWFDLVVVDAPCSGEGLFRKNALSHLEWSIEDVNLCAARQRRILNVAQKLIGPRGTLVYSTCTYNQQENELNARWMEHEKEMQYLPVVTEKGWNITEKSPGHQMFPHKVKGEGFYISAFRQLEPIRSNEKKKRDFHNLTPISKKETGILTDWLSNTDQLLILKNREGQVFHAPKHLEHELRVLDCLLPNGVWLHETGQFKGNDFIPSHALALQPSVIKPEFSSVALDESQALLYLKKELNTIPETSKGWNIVRYKGLSLGWIRNLGNRFNNYFPTEQRIRMSLE